MGGSASRRAATRVKPAPASNVTMRAPTGPNHRAGRWTPSEEPTEEDGGARRGRGRGTSAQSPAQHGSPRAARGRGPRPVFGTGAGLGVGGVHSTARTSWTTQPGGRESASGGLVRGGPHRGEGREMGVSRGTPPTLQRLQAVLYTQAKPAPGPLARDAALPRGAGVRGAGGVPASALSSGVAGACLGVNPVREPDAGNPHVRFDEQGREPACAVVVSRSRVRRPIRRRRQDRARL